MPSTNGLNTNKFKLHIRSANRYRFYANFKGAFYRFTDGSFMRAVPTINGTMMRRCHENGQIIPRERRTKKLRLFIRRVRAAMIAAS
jgi:hypothetical protein